MTSTSENKMVLDSRRNMRIVTPSDNMSAEMSPYADILLTNDNRSVVYLTE